MAIQYVDETPSSGSTIQYLDNGESKPIRKVPLSVAFDVASEMTPASRIHSLFPKAGGAIAENIGRMGAEAGYPEGAAKVGAVMGLPIAIAPEIASSALALTGLETSQDPVARAIRATPKDLGPEFQAGEKAAGISGDLPVQRGAMARFPNMSGNPSIQPPPQAPLVAPKSYPKDINSFLNFARARVQAFGDNLTPQELDDYKTMLSTNIKAMKMKGLAHTEPYAIASQLQKEVTSLHNSVIPGREQLNKVYAISKAIHPELGDFIADGIKKYGTKAIGAVLAGIGIGAGTQLFK